MRKKYLRDFIARLDRGDFYDAHEALEALWFPQRFSKDDEIKVLKGYINAAVSFELIKRCRKAPAHKVFQTYLKYKKLRLSLYSKDDSEYLAVERCIDDLVLKNEWDFLLT